MSLAVRIIPRLDIKGPNLVKGMHLEGLRVLGKPERFARYYYEQGADELFYQDVVASLYGRNSLNEIISKTAKEIFIPLTVGGGIRTLDDIAITLHSGADKVSINTAAHEDPSLITKASRVYGKSTIVVAIEAIHQPDGSYQAFTDNGRNRTDRDVVSWAKEVESLGAGEIILTSVDREGSGKGLDMTLIRKVQSSISIPLIVHGGVGNAKDILDILHKYPVSGIAIASMLHYHYITKYRELDGFEDGGNIDFLKSNKKYLGINPMIIPDLKKELEMNEIICRMN